MLAKADEGSRGEWGGAMVTAPAERASRAGPIGERAYSRNEIASAFKKYFTSLDSSRCHLRPFNR